jgi:hypothetical protein
MKVLLCQPPAKGDQRGVKACHHFLSDSAYAHANDCVASLIPEMIATLR